MSTILNVCILMSCAGGLGGLANYLLQPAKDEKGLTLAGAFPFVIAGAIAALAVPLFLSLAQSSIIQNAIAQGDMKADQALILIGFCVVAGFSSRRFMGSLTEKMVQIERTAKQAFQKSAEAKEASEEAKELVEENIDRVAEVRGEDHGSVQTPSDENVASPRATGRNEPITNITPQEHMVLMSTALHPARTLSGVAQDAKLPREIVKVIVPDLVQKGLLQFTTSANTGGSRIQITPSGAQTLSKVVIVDSRANSNEEDGSTNG